MIKRLAEQRAARTKDQRFGDDYNFGATYYDARDEALRRGDRAIGTEHMLLALLKDPASPAAKAIGRDLESARTALDLLDAGALSAIGVAAGMTVGPVAVRTQGKLRLTPGAKAIFTGIRAGARRNRRAGLGIVFNALLDLQPPDPAAQLLASLDIDVAAVRSRFIDREQDPR